MSFRLIKHISLLSGPLSLAFLSLGLFWALKLAPHDVVQGSVMRILYVHVPCAWMSLFVYAFLTALSFFFLIFRWPILWPFIEKALPLGAWFTFLALITGSLWGKPTWGTWWVWDARLTSMLILLFIYMGIISLHKALTPGIQACLITATFILIGALNLPIIHYSVEWWHTLHQSASVFRFGKPSVDKAILHPLLMMALGHFFLFSFLLTLNVQQHFIEKKMQRHVRK